MVAIAFWYTIFFSIEGNLLLKRAVLFMRVVNATFLCSSD